MKQVLNNTSNFTIRFKPEVDCGKLIRSIVSPITRRLPDFEIQPN